MWRDRQSPSFTWIYFVQQIIKNAVFGPYIKITKNLSINYKPHVS